MALCAPQPPSTYGVLKYLSASGSIIIVLLDSYDMQALVLLP